MVGNPTFELPIDGSSYTEAVFLRTRKLIKTGIWKDLDSVNLEAWLRNFTTPEERYFAACILDRLLYRSEAQTVSLMHELFDRAIPNLNRENAAVNPVIGSWLDYFKSEFVPGQSSLIIVPIIRSYDPPTKSGPLVARLFRRHLKLDEDHMFWPWQLEEQVKNMGVKAVLFIDDFMGTGHQLEDFVTDFSMESFIDSLYCVYAPITAHQDGLDYVKCLYPNLHVTCAEHLTNNVNLFHPDCAAFSDGKNSPEVVADFYDGLIQKSKFDNNAARKGYGKLGIAYSFKHATPDNTIPLLWWRSETWNPLFTR